MKIHSLRNNSRNPIQLDWTRDYFGGRTKELKILRSSLPQKSKNSDHGETGGLGSSSSSPPCRIFFIEGVSGSGKSSLVQEAFRPVRASTPLAVAKTKFEDSHATTPLQAWTDATISLLSELEQDQEFQNHLQTSFQRRSELSADYLDILRSQPSFQSLSNFSTTVSLERSSEAEKDHSFERLKLAYRELYRVVCEYATVVLFLDDIQWAHQDDFEIMDTILEDSQLKEQLIFVGAHRPVEAPHGLHRIKKPRKQICKTLVLGPLTPLEMTQMLKKLIGHEDKDLAELVVLLKRKTGGNPFFLRQLVQAMEEQGMINYSVTKCAWEWDLKRIQTETSLSDNVLEIVSQKIIQHPQLAKTLSLAACLGSSRISVTVMMWVLEEDVTLEIQSEEELLLLLNDAVEMGLIDRTGTREYRFAHDKIRESALTLLPQGESLEKMHLQVGLRLRALWDQCPEPSNDRLLFQVLRQLNSGRSLIKTNKERYSLAQLNYDGAEAAMRQSAFYPAMDFLHRTKELLTNVMDSEIDVHDFALKTETALARMEYCCGFLDQCITRANVIIKKSRNDEDKATAMHLKAICFNQTNKPMECIEVATEALTSFGVDYPRKFLKIHVLRRYLKAKKYMKTLSDEDILNLPRTQVERYQYASEFLLRIGECALTYGLDDHLACCTLTGVDLSVQKGPNSMTALTLMVWGFLLAKEGDIAEVYRFGKLGMKVSEEFVGGILDYRAQSLYYLWQHQLRHPYADGVEPFSKVLKNMWAQGGLEGVVLDTSGYLRLYYLAGFKLGPLLNDMRQFRSLCNDFGMTMVRSLIDPFAQMIVNLVAGPSEEMLRGEFMVESESIKFWNQSKSKIGIQLYYFHKMMVAYYFNSYKLAGDLATKVTQMYLEGFDSLVPYRFFFWGLVAWTAYGITGKYMYRKLARTLTAQIETFVKAGMINCTHSLLFLKAERAAALCRTGKNCDAVQKAYDETIAASARRGYLYDQALANERAGRYFIKIGDKGWAVTYLMRAQECYLDWQAVAKAKQMIREYQDLVIAVGDSPLAQSSCVNSRARLSVLAAKKLHKIESVEVDGSFDDDL